MLQSEWIEAYCHGINRSVLGCYLKSKFEQETPRPVRCPIKLTFSRRTLIYALEDWAAVPGAPPPGCDA